MCYSSSGSGVLVFVVGSYWIVVCCWCCRCWCCCCCCCCWGCFWLLVLAFVVLMFCVDVALVSVFEVDFVDGAAHYQVAVVLLLLNCNPFRAPKFPLY